MKRVEPAEVNIVNIEFGEYSVIDGNHKPTTAEIEAVHAEMWLQIERTQRRNYGNCSNYPVRRLGA